MRRNLSLPEICRNSNLLGVLIITELLVFALCLIAARAEFFMTFGLWSLYALWAVLVPCLLLCWFKRFIERLSFFLGSIIVLLLVLMVIAAIEGFIGFKLSDEFDADRFVRHCIVGTLLTSGAIWFFGFLEGLKNRSRAEAESKVLALQSRIQPHFLFNSLNSISELTSTSPADAEQAIQSLSMLFRASLENQRKRHSLSSELRLCREYINLERWRLQSRLSIEWNVSVGDESLWEVPKLILQPLIENAIVHGVQDDGSVSISIDIRETSKHLSLMINNAIGAESSLHSRNGIALDNIRERLFVLYDDEQVFRVKKSNGDYSVIMRFPKQRQNQVYSGR